MKSNKRIKIKWFLKVNLWILNRFMVILSTVVMATAA